MTPVASLNQDAYLESASTLAIGKVSNDFSVYYDGGRLPSLL